MKHPLLNPDSPHYDTDCMPSIYELEKELTLAESIGWCKGNILKYKLRLGKKSTIDHFDSEAERKAKDIKKIETYEAYRDLLMRIADEIGIQCRVSQNEEPPHMVTTRMAIDMYADVQYL